MSVLSYIAAVFISVTTLTHSSYVKSKLDISHDIDIILKMTSTICTDNVVLIRMRGLNHMCRHRI